jgi:hypothetical protein
MERKRAIQTDAARKRVLVGIAAAAAGAALTYGGYRLQRHMKNKRAAAAQDHQLDKALTDTMDCSDPVATY